MSNSVSFTVCIHWLCGITPPFPFILSHPVTLALPPLSSLSISLLKWQQVVYMNCVCVCVCVCVCAHSDKKRQCFLNPTLQNLWYLSMCSYCANIYKMYTNTGEGNACALTSCHRSLTKTMFKSPRGSSSGQTVYITWYDIMCVCIINWRIDVP